MIDKFNLDERESKFLIKKLIVDVIYNLAKMEGCNVTLPETQVIYDGINDPNITLDDLRVLLNLKSALKYYLNKEFGATFTFEFLLAINKRVSHNESLDWGVLRYGAVGISGTDYKPTVPLESEVREQLEEILSIENVTERALKLFLWMCRSQLFWDGNKRTASICCNKLILDNGKGLFMVPEKELKQFNTLLSEYYTTNDDTNIIQFLYDKAIVGITYNK